MNEFLFYLHQGVSHITDIKGIDHMVFIITLCAVYQFKNWKKVLVLVTAFTIGHTITLALSSLNIIRINPKVIETLIPVTILLTSIYNVIRSENYQRVSLNYLFALMFGFIHGMGFSNFFRAMMEGIDDSILFPLFSFNLGIEIGQLVIVSAFMLILYLCTVLLNVKHREWNLYISGAGGGIAIIMIIKALVQ